VCRKLTVGSGFTLRITGTATSALTVGNSAAGNNDITIENGGAIRHESTAPSGNPFTLANPALDVLRIDAGGYFLHNTARSFATPFPAGSCSFDPASTFEYGQGASTAISLANRTFGNLHLSATGPKTFTGTFGSVSTLTINGEFNLTSSFVTMNFSITSSATCRIHRIRNQGGFLNFQASTMPLVITGDILNTGTIIPSGLQSVTFDGSTEYAGPSIHWASGFTVNPGATLAVQGPMTWSNFAQIHGTLVMRELGSVGSPPIFNPGSTLEFDATTARAIGPEWATGAFAPPLHVIVRSGTNLLPAGEHPVAGPIEFLGGDITLDPAAILIVDGDWTANGGTLHANGGTVRFSGSNQVISQSPAHDFGSVELSNVSGNVLLAPTTDLVVTGTLTLSGGRIITGPRMVVVESGGSATRTSGHVDGNLVLRAPVGPTSLRFDIGSGADYTPVELAFNNVSAAGELLASTAAGDHPDIENSAIVPGRSANRSWSVTNLGASFDQYGATFTFVPGDVDGGADPLAFAVAKSDAGIWTQPAVGVRTATSTQAVGMTSMSVFIVGETETASNVIAAVSPAGCISTSNPCQTVPVTISRTDATDIRAYSVGIQLSPDLELCGSPGASITQGPYLSSVGTTLFQVIDNGGGSYTVDCAILGAPCGATAAAGTLFDVSVKKATGGPDGSGSLLIGALTLRDCSNSPMAVSAGSGATIPIDTVAPAALATVASAQVTSGNDADGTTKVTVTWSGAEGGSTVALYRKGFGSHPEYDDAGGAVPDVPATPASALGNGWSLTGLSASGQQDEVGARDFWYYVAFLTDDCGNVSAASNLTGGVLNYHLGDVSDGATPGTGNNLVGSEDVSLLGANYGLTGAAVDPVNYLDVGPTTSGSVHARPTTDNAIDFDDFILFAINYGEVSAPGVIAFDRGSLPASDRLELETTGRLATGEELSATLHLEGSGRVQGMSVKLAWNPRVVVPVGFAAGRTAVDQGALALSPAPGAVDVALLGVREVGLAGHGELATVSFRVIAAGDPAIVLASIRARDHGNRDVAIESSVHAAAFSPGVTQLLPVSPNPSRGPASFAFSLARPGRVELAVCSVDGRKLRTLVSEERDAGIHQVSWDGMDEAGRRVAPGVYYATFLTGEKRQSRTITVVR
jgi:hypothetical protein